MARRQSPPEVEHPDGDTTSRHLHGCKAWISRVTWPWLPRRPVVGRHDSRVLEARHRPHRGQKRVCHSAVALHNLQTAREQDGAIWNRPLGALRPFGRRFIRPQEAKIGGCKWMMSSDATTQIPCKRQPCRTARDQPTASHFPFSFTLSAHRDLLCLGMPRRVSGSVCSLLQCATGSVHVSHISSTHPSRRRLTHRDRDRGSFQDQA
ncbi:hypothetical protein B0H67DRAFT_212671 [Lasiosphaeris hirsuta]|uniref:Uncharacterized protein n=1 Tax=Lasiosphaeris hirsuta TaxID=260670 RepID=A0AA40ASD2_9PEZI|nr:hypothetical protein B0H67DRAFT_212671 [Lasiosphaeris hirsuta]